MSLQAHTPADLAALLDGQEPGEASEALLGLLGDEWEEVYPPSAKDELTTRLEAAGWPEPFAACPTCATVFLRRFWPEGGRCRECAAALEPGPRWSAPEAPAPLATRTLGPTPEARVQAWSLDTTRETRDLGLGESERDWLAERALELEGSVARGQAANWLSGAGPDPSDEHAPLPLTPRARTDPSPLDALDARVLKSEPALRPLPTDESRGAPDTAREARGLADHAEVAGQVSRATAGGTASPATAADTTDRSRQADLADADDQAREVAPAHEADQARGADQTRAADADGADDHVFDPDPLRAVDQGERARATDPTDPVREPETAGRAEVLVIVDSKGSVASRSPNRAEPDSTEPDSTEPDSTETDSTETDSTEPDSTETGAERVSTPHTAPASAQPDSAQPLPAGPVAPGPRSEGVPAGSGLPPAPLPSAPEVLVPAGPTELREDSGRRAGRVHSLALGSTSAIGTARRVEVVLRQRGVAFKHALIEVRSDGSATLRDLGVGKTWVGEELLVAQAERALRDGDLLRCGEAVLSVKLHAEVLARPARPPAAPPESQTQPGSSPAESSPAHTQDLPAQVASPSQAASPTQATNPAPARPPRDHSEQPWRAPTPAEVAAARHTPPKQILAALPASQLDLVARAAGAIPLPRWRAAQPRAERPFVDHEAQAFASLVRSVLNGRFLPGPPEEWLRWEEEEGSFLFRSALPDGTTVLLAPWDLLARLPAPLAGQGSVQVGRFLELLLPPRTERLVAEEESQLPGGFWRCRYVASGGLCGGRFGSIDARSNGHVLTATLTPRFPLQGASPDFAEDPLDQAMNDLRARAAWRPPPRGHGAPAPRVPSGGRHRDRHLPRRSRARDR